MDTDRDEAAEREKAGKDGAKTTDGEKTIANIDRIMCGIVDEMEFDVDK